MLPKHGVKFLELFAKLSYTPCCHQWQLGFSAAGVSQKCALNVLVNSKSYDKPICDTTQRLSMNKLGLQGLRPNGCVVIEGAKQSWIAINSLVLSQSQYCCTSMA